MNDDLQSVMRFDDAPPWERLIREPARAYSAFLTYLHLAPEKRSQNAAYARWREERGGDSADSSPRRAPGRWVQWSVKYHWKERAEQWDAAQRAQKADEAQRLADARFERKLALLEQVDRSRAELILQLHMIYKRLLADNAGGFAVDHQTDKGTGSFREFNYREDLALVHKCLNDLEAGYFDDAALNTAPSNAEQQAQAVIGLFRYTSESRKKEHE